SASPTPPPGATPIRYLVNDERPLRLGILSSKCLWVWVQRRSGDKSGQRALMLFRIAQAGEVDAEDRGQGEPYVIRRSIGAAATQRRFHVRQAAVRDLDELAPLDAGVL